MAKASKFEPFLHYVAFSWSGTTQLKNPGYQPRFIKKKVIVPTTNKPGATIAHGYD